MSDRGVEVSRATIGALTLIFVILMGIATILWVSSKRFGWLRLTGAVVQILCGIALTLYGFGLIREKGEDLVSRPGAIAERKAWKLVGPLFIVMGVTALIDALTG
jgi:uncharacterized membrane protein